MFRSITHFAPFLTFLLFFASVEVISAQSSSKPQVISTSTSPQINTLPPSITSSTPTPPAAAPSTPTNPSSADVARACSICQHDEFCCYSTETGVIRGVSCCIDSSGNSCVARTGECTDSSSARVAGIVAFVLFGLVAVLVLTLIVCIFIPIHRRRRNEINAHPEYHLNRHSCFYYLVHPRHMQKQQINPAPVQPAAQAPIPPPAAEAPLSPAI